MMWWQCCFTVVALVLAVAAAPAADPATNQGAASAVRPPALRVLRDEYPRAYFFRSSEAMAANPHTSYKIWEACFERLMGIEGKSLDEELPGRSQRNVEFFTRFKQRHPDQLVMLHYNGDARDPRDHTGQFFAGHWLYGVGARITADVLAQDGETEISVDRPELFHIGIGRYRTSNDDVGLCELTAQGRPDWGRAEQVELLAVDVKRKAIRVRRACFGTTARSFTAGRAYAAVHVSEGPWGGATSRLLWLYNYATCCPRDVQGRTCADVLANDLAAHFGPGGDLAAFDGLEFDVLYNQPVAARRVVDADADGQPDGGWVGGRNAYGIGVVEFCRQLRYKMGPQKLILADGMEPTNQRAFHLLNGIESEGWPILNDWELRDWSGGLNRHFFWASNAFAPVLNYINHKYSTPGDAPGQLQQPDVPLSIHRLVMAVSTFTDSAFCYIYAPPKQSGELFGIWDELQKGGDHQPGWLGRPRGPAVRLAERESDTLGGLGAAELRKRLHGHGVTFSLDGDRVRIAASDPQAQRMRFRLSGVPCRGPDLLVIATLHGATMRGYPGEMPRLAWMGITGPGEQLTEAEPPATGMAVRGKEETELAPDSGAMVQWFAHATLGDQPRGAYLVHPPYRGGVGYTFWQRDTDVPPAAQLTFFTGMGPRSPGRSDGVTFRVLVAEVRDRLAGPFRQVFEHSQIESRWIEHRVSLADWAGKRVRLKFVSDCGPKDNAVADHSYWSDVATVVSDAAHPAVQPVEFMTWVGDRPFASSFYFSAVTAPTVELQWTVEGPEPIWLSAVRAHPSADAIYREFEHGLVLGNPSPHDYSFDLPRLLPGQKFRRLRGSAGQDRTTNNGSAVDEPLTLGSKDGLFLIRQ